MQVVHDISEFQDGEERILVLKDSSILENEEEGDQLVSIQLEEQQRLKKNLENKKKKPVYTGYDDEEFNFGGGVTKKSILSHYDEEIEKNKKTGFTLDSDGTVKLSEDDVRNQVSEKLRSNPISLSFDKMKEIQDYYTKEEAEITFKKPKVKKKKKVRQKTTDEDSLITENKVNDPDSMEIESTSSITTTQSRRRENLDDVSFVDDDDLQQALARARKMAAKKVAKTSVEEIAKTLTQERETQEEDDDVPDDGLVISDTSEFVRSLSIAATAPRLVESDGLISDNRLTNQTEDEKPEEEEEEEETNDVVMEEDTDEDKIGGWKVAGVVEDQDMASINEEPKLVGVVEEEPLVSNGMAATLALLQQKGFSIKPSEEQIEKERIQRERQKWLAEQRRRDLERQNEREREKQRAKEKGYRGGGGGRDSDSSYRDREHLREMEARFKDYKPDINLEYVDEFGNQLTPKEAFRQLSHKFHGKSSGKSKTEKRLKKLEEERKLKAMSSVDTPLNMATALQERQKASGSAHVVLSVGNRAVVPNSMMPNNDNRASSKSVPSVLSTNGPNIITVNGGLTGQSMNAPEREKVTFGLKRKAEAETEKPSKKSKDE
ncbi:SART-1 protein [Gigaspora rosea]|uniref:SART-1 protein n=1 Tax=Gigaspora rosea TaxID=44941 RepID=A0A397UMA7_9GLOM|nr:SART-1 protein [Gigaspora rosea]